MGAGLGIIGIGILWWLLVMGHPKHDTLASRMPAERSVAFFRSRDLMTLRRRASWLMGTNIPPLSEGKGQGKLYELGYVRHVTGVGTAWLLSTYDPMQKTVDLTTSDADPSLLIDEETMVPSLLSTVPRLADMHDEHSALWMSAAALPQGGGEASTVLRSLLMGAKGILVREENMKRGTIFLDDVIFPAKASGMIANTSSGAVFSIRLASPSIFLDTIFAAIAAENQDLADGLLGIIHGAIEGLPTSVVANIVRSPLAIDVGSGSGMSNNVFVQGRGTTADYAAVRGALQPVQGVIVRSRTFFDGEHEQQDIVSDDRDHPKEVIGRGWSSDILIPPTEKERIWFAATRDAAFAISDDKDALRKGIDAIDWGNREHLLGVIRFHVPSLSQFLEERLPFLAQEMEDVISRSTKGTAEVIEAKARSVSGGTLIEWTTEERKT